MRPNRGVRIGAMIGTAGGLLRAGGSFAPTLVVSDDARSWLYVVIDICLALGLSSLCLARRHAIKTTGALGAFLAIVSLMAGRVGPLITNLDLYPMTAAAVVIGVLMLAFSEWQAGRIAPWIPLAFALSLLAGSTGMFVAGANALFILSGILFGSAFAVMAMTPYDCADAKQTPLECRAGRT